MRSWVGPLTLLYLLALAGAGVLLADLSWQSVTGYRSAYALDRTFPAGPALASRLVLVVFDGLRVDRGAELPTMRALAAQGASGTLEAPQPSLSNPARAAMVTGAWPEVSGVTNNSQFAPPPIQSVFSLARERGLPLEVVGLDFWLKAFGEAVGDSYRGYPRVSSYEPADLIAWQAEACDLALERLKTFEAGLMVVGLVAGDEAGHQFGGESGEYRRVTLAVDACLGRLQGALSGQDVALVAVSDHGHIHRRGGGGHGGSEPEVLFAPFAMAGQGIRAAESMEAQMVDIAPTVSVLLGLPIPANNQGRVLWEALAVPGESEALLRALERDQREALRAHMPDREASLASLRSGRLPISVAAILWFFGAMLAALWGRWTGAIAFAVAAFIVSYYALFYAFALEYSLSAIVREEYLNSFFLRDVLAATLAYGVAAACLAGAGAREPQLFLRPAVVLTSVFGLMVTRTNHRHGLLMQDWMLDLGPGFKAYLDMLAVQGIVLGTLLALGASFAYRRWRGRAA